MLKDIKSDPRGSVGKESACNAGDLGSVPEWERSSREGKGYPLQNSGLENSMDCIVHGVTKSRTRLTDLHTHTPAIATRTLLPNNFFFLISNRRDKILPVFPPLLPYYPTILQPLFQNLFREWWDERKWRICNQVQNTLETIEQEWDGKEHEKCGAG